MTTAGKPVGQPFYKAIDFVSHQELKSRSVVLPPHTKPIPTTPNLSNIGLYVVSMAPVVKSKLSAAFIFPAKTKIRFDRIQIGTLRVHEPVLDLPQVRLACECVVLFAGLQTAQLTKRNRSIVASSPHVSYGSNSTKMGCRHHVRFTSDSNRNADIPDRQLRATRRHHRCPSAISAFLWKADTRQCD